MHQSSFAFASIPRSGASLLAPLDPFLQLTPLPLLEAAQQVQKKRWDPNRKLLLLVRDPRSLLLSRHPAFPRQPFFGFDHSLHLPPDWISYSDPGLLDYFAAAQQLREAAGIDLELDLLCLRFEDLLSNPQRQKHRLHHFTGLPLELLEQHLPLALKSHSVPPWQLPQNARRIIRQFQLQPALFDLLETWGYEPNTSWFDQLTHAAPEALQHRQGQIVGYFTEGNHYVAEADRLRCSVQRLGLPIQLTPIPNQGDWLANVRFKVRFLTELRKKHRGPLLYVDVDAILHKDPWPYLDTLDCDVAFCAFRYGKAGSGTIYLDDTPGAGLFLQDWDRRLQMAPEAWDQSPFDDITREQASTPQPPFHVQLLPPELCYIFDRRGQSEGTPQPPIVEHLQASRENKEGPNLDRRVSRLREISPLLQNPSHTSEPLQSLPLPTFNNVNLGASIDFRPIDSLLKTGDPHSGMPALQLKAQEAAHSKNIPALLRCAQYFEILQSPRDAWSTLVQAQHLSAGYRDDTLVQPKFERQSVLVESPTSNLAEQIRLVRFLPKAFSMGASVTAVAHPALLTLFRRSFPEITFVKCSTKLPFLPTLRTTYEQLALTFATTQDSIAESFRPLIPDVLQTTFFRTLNLNPNLLRVGISWNKLSSHNQSISFELLSNILNQLPSTVYSLQRDDFEQDFIELRKLLNFPIHPFKRPFKFQKLDSYVSYLASLDLIIATTNLTAHLAGAIGKPCVVIRDNSPNAPWPILGPTTSFYPHTRLFSQNSAVTEIVNFIKKVVRVSPITQRGPSSQKPKQNFQAFPTPLLSSLQILKPFIVSLRRGVNIASTWQAFDTQVKQDINSICAHLNTRWLVSVCDTYADFGSEIEKRNALLISMLVNMEKVAQTYLHWRVDHQTPFEVPEVPKPGKFDLWDGMRSMDMDLGDVTNNLFRRMQALLDATPHLAQIYREVLRRMKTSNTILAALNKYHEHVFDNHTHWRNDPRYDKWRQSGRLPGLPSTH